MKYKNFFTDTLDTLIQCAENFVSSQKHDLGIENFECQDLNRSLKIT